MVDQGQEGRGIEVRTSWTPIAALTERLADHEAEVQRPHEGVRPAQLSTGDPGIGEGADARHLDPTHARCPTVVVEEERDDRRVLLAEEAQGVELVPQAFVPGPGVFPEVLKSVEDVFDHAVDEVLTATDVVVQGRRSEVDLDGDTTHGDRVGTGPVGDTEGGGQDLLAGRRSGRFHGDGPFWIRRNR